MCMLVRQAGSQAHVYIIVPTPFQLKQITLFQRRFWITVTTSKLPPLITSTMTSFSYHIPEILILILRHCLYS